MRVLAQSAHRPSVSSTPVGARSTGGWAPIAECEPDAMSVACTSPEGRSTGSMLEVAGSASTEGRRPTHILAVTVSSPEDRSTTIVYLYCLSPFFQGPLNSWQQTLCHSLLSRGPFNSRCP